MTEAKWVSLDDHVRSCLTTAINTYCRNSLMGDQESHIGIAVDGRSVTTISRKIASFVDIDESIETDDHIISIKANEKLHDLVKLVESSKPNDLYRDIPRDWLSDRTLTKYLGIFFASRKIRFEDRLLFSQYPTDRYELQRYTRSDTNAVFIYNNQDLFVIRRASYNGAMYIMLKSHAEQFLATAKALDTKQAVKSNENMVEFLRTQQITSSPRLRKLIGSSTPSALINEDKIDKALIHVASTFDSIQEDLMTLQYAKSQLKKLGGGKKVNKLFKDECKSLVDGIYSEIS